MRKFRMDSIPKRFLTVCALVMLAVTASAGNHPARFDAFQENEYRKDETPVNANDYRLPKSIIPINYDITLSEINFNASTYKGDSTIEVLMKASAKEIILNVGKVDIRSITVYNEGLEVSISEKIINATTETYKIVLEETLKENSSISIDLKFDGYLRNDMIGFYKSSYYDDKDEQRWLAATQFESTHARHAFPCFDEPEFKAMFEIHIQLPDGYNCLSNMNFNYINSTKYCHFEVTPKMSTYLVAFVVSDFQAYPSNGADLKMWARPNAKSQAAYAQSIGVKALDELSKLFDENYNETMSKMDMVAVPDFSAGAMENWGLITYRETASLYDEEHSSDIAQQRIASVIVHECAHMWFGNLVTPEWWSYLWLSEGFARYYQYMGTDMITENWKMAEQFIVEQFQTAMAVDSAEDSKPITMPEEDMITVSQIATAGGTITYNKGASIIRMMEKTFGSDALKDALRQYIKDRKFKSSKPADLWRAIQQFVDASLNISSIMKSWTEQAGYPYITVTVGPDSIKLAQDRFLLRSGGNNVPQALWSVPITLSSGSDPNTSTKPVFWLTKQEDEIKEKDKIADWLIINVKSAGFYRVNYDRNSWNRIIELLTIGDINKIPVENRAAIVDDLVNLARAEIVDYELVFKALQYLKREKQYLPFKSALTGLDYLARVTAESSDYEFFKDYIASLIRNVYKELTFDDKANDDRLTILLRRELNDRACSLNNEECIKKSRDYFDKWKNNQRPVPKNQRSVVYCTTIREGTSEDWDFLYEELRKTNVAAEEVTIQSALGCSQDPEKLEKYLLGALSGFEKSRIREQDIPSVFSGVYTASLKNAEFMIDFANEHYEELYNYYKKYDQVGSLITGALKRYPIKRLMDKVEKILKTNATHIVPNAKSIEKSLNFVQQEIKFFNKYLPPGIDSVKENDFSIRNTTAYRLPGYIIPSTYDIHLIPHISPEKNFTFDGQVKIMAEVKRSVNKITLHTDQLSNLKVTVRGVGDNGNMKVLKNKEPTRRQKYHFTDIGMEEPIEAGTKISIEITYKGILNTEMRGFYRSSYRTKSGTRWLAATHLEPTGARRVFPCFDEPALKAKFSISVKAPTNYAVISNTKVKTKKDGIYEFETTPPMSTYLVAIVVSDFMAKSNKDSKHEYSVYANPLVINQTDYALKVMGPVTRWFEEKLGHDYDLDKMDMVALPDFTSGAMENWGLLTYRETNLLYDPVRMSSLANMQSIRNVIAHEITHQWFGDLVSPHWWDYLWLNEGFARYFQYHAYTKEEADWKLETQFVVDHLQTSFSKDGATGTHAITHRVYSPTEIRAIFDKISYAKAASIIRMFEKLTSQKIFFGGLKRYLEARKLDAAKPEDLFQALQAETDSDNDFASNVTVTELMKSWTEQKGFPVLSVKFEDNNKATLSQTRFYQRPKKENPNDATWLIPISWATKNNANFTNTQRVIYLKEKEQTVEIEREKDEWVILNLQQTGYYRVNYDENMWNLIIKALNSADYEKIHEINRANIVDDLLHIGRAGQVSYDTVFSGLSYLANETELAPWKAAFTGLFYLNNRFTGHSDVYNTYKDFVLRLIEPTFKRLKFDDNKNDRPTDVLLRRLVLEWLCNFDEDKCVKEALQQFEHERDSVSVRNDVEPNKRLYVYCTAIRKGTKEDWEYLWQKLVKSDFATEKLSALNALACSQDPELLKRLMDETIKKNSEIRFQDAKTVFSNIVNNGLVGVESAMDYIQVNYQKMKEYLGDESIAKTTLSTIAKRVSTDKLLKKFEDLVENNVNTMPELAKSLKSSLNRAREENAWYKEKIPKIFKWLEIDNSKNKVGKPKNSEYRLPTFAKPEAYDIVLKPYFEDKDFAFEGEVTIDVKLEEGSSHIVLHKDELNIKEITVEPKERKIADETYDSTTHKWTLIFEDFMEAGTTLKLKIKYDGKLRDDMRGFYRSSYIDENKKTKWIATTHFEPTYARRAFPCFDEPSFKAYFTITISAPKGYHVLSNRGSKPKTTPDGDRTINAFEKSLKMSSYLVAFVVSEYVQTPDKDHRVSVWSRPQLKDYMKRAAPAGEEALKFLEKFTQIEYPQKEMNLVSIPDFDMGAMENWGLVTFREYGLTYDEQKTSASYKRFVNIVISHELVHQWFGNWVTCEWWDYTWLNEGFAAYVSYLASNEQEPKWQLLKQFVTRELQVGLEFDSSETSHAMNNKVFTPTEAQDGFDKIAYQKSASVLRMLHHSFGDKVFVEALHSYLDARQYNAGRPEYLYKAIEDRMSKEAKKPGNLEVDVSTVMTSWTEHAGYPLVKAARKNDKVTLSQERFLISSTDASKKNTKYWVPITYATESESNFDKTDPKLWLNDKTKEISVPPKDKWYLINVQEIGFYRVNYDLENWQALINLLNSDNYTEIADENRAQIIDDSFNLARAGYVKYDVAFNASKYLTRETNYLPWSAYFNAVAYLSQRLEADAELKEIYRKYVLSIIDNAYKKIGLKEDMAKDDHFDQLTRELVTIWACKYGHKDCLEKASNYYSDDSVNITPNIATAVYCTAMEHGDSKLWDEMWDKYLNALLATDYITILKGLGCSKDAKVLEKYLERIIEPGSKIRRQDTGTAFSSVYTSSQVGLHTTIEFFIKNLDKLYEFFEDWHEVGSLLTSLAGQISNDEHIKTLEKLASDPKAANIKKSTESAIKISKKNTDWFKNNEKNIRSAITMSIPKEKGGAAIRGAFFLLIFVVQIVVFSI